MNSLTHIVAPEEIMALLDGELTRAEAEAVEAHIDGCAECASLRDEMRGTSEELRAWAVPAAGAEMERAVAERAEGATAKGGSARPPRRVTPLTIRNWRLWAIGGGGAAAVAVAYVIFVVSLVSYEDRHDFVQPMAEMKVNDPGKAGANSGDTFSGYADALQADAPPATRSRTEVSSGSPASKAHLSQGMGVLGGVPPAPPPSNAVTMIARTASMTVTVKDFDAAHKQLDLILERRSAYAADLTIVDETPPRGLQGSLRVPVGELTATLSELRILGHVERESQSGEEVSEQHTDLVARLKNAREAEARLQDILAHRAGKMEDVLAVEDKISETRGEIEQMEAEQKALEHRVEFASIDLKLVEEYKAQLGGGSTSIGNEMGNALVAGLRHGGGSLLGLVLLVEEFGPVLLIWAVILGVPAVLVWRRLRRVGN